MAEEAERQRRIAAELERREAEVRRLEAEEAAALAAEEAELRQLEEVHRTDACGAARNRPRRAALAESRRRHAAAFLPPTAVVRSVRALAQVLAEAEAAALAAEEEERMCAARGAAC